MKPVSNLQSLKLGVFNEPLADCAIKDQLINSFKTAILGLPGTVIYPFHKHLNQFVLLSVSMAPQN